MRLLSFRYRGVDRLGVPTDDGYIDLNRGYEMLLNERHVARATEVAHAYVPTSTTAFLGGGKPSLDAARETIDYVAACRSTQLDELLTKGVLIPTNSARLLVPLVPSRIICVGRNYVDHINEASRPMPEVPVLFIRFAQGLVGHGEPIVRPHVSSELDWEGELAVIIGRHCRHLKVSQAFEMVAGYTVFNDASIRDYQKRGVQWMAGKNFYGTGAYGPWIVLKDALPEPAGRQLTVTLNGEVVQSANTSDMIFDVPSLLSYITEFTPLAPGDMIVTGTPAGVGFVRTPPRFLTPGDVISVQIEGIGLLENSVIDEAWPPSGAEAPAS